MEREIIEGYSVSPQQKHVWSLDQANSPAYRAQCAILIEGSLDRRTLEAAINTVAERHEILRTTFRRLPEMRLPIQVIGESNLLYEHDIDLCGQSETDQQSKIDALFREMSEQPFDLTFGPLARLRLAALSPSRHVLMMCISAMCADTVTLDNIVAEIAHCYRAAALDEPMQYADISAWLNELLITPDNQLGRQFWQNREFPDHLITKLPLEKRPDPLQTPAIFTPAVFEFALEPEMVSKLETFVHEYGTTVPTFLFTCWAVLLRRSGLESENAVAASFICRKYGELKKALGPLEKYLPVPCTIEEKAPVSRVLAKIDEDLREVWKWQECFDWEDIYGSSSNAADTPFSPFSFNYVEPPATCRAGDITFSLMTRYVCTDRFKVKLCCVRRENSLIAEFHWDPTVYSAEDIGRAARGYQALIESALRQPDVPVEELDAVGRVERDRMLFEFNCTSANFPRGKALHELIEEQARQAPDKVAVTYEDAQCTYAELNARSNQLANYLRNFGVGPEVIAAICMERSIDLVVAILGVLKAGGAYVPLDPDYPKDRLSFMLQDSQALVLLTQQRLIERLPEHGARVITLDASWQEIIRESAENPASGVKADNPAYVIYTSGSTGRPKGVMIPHAAICNHMFWMQEVFPLEESDRVLQKTPFSFDASVWEFYAPLLAGARLVMARPGGHQDPPYLIDAMIEQKISVVQFVPSLLRALLDADGFENCKSLKRVFCGGEALSIELQERFYARLQASLHNLYGPTEATIDATFWTCLPRADHHMVLIGRPIANAQAYLLDAQLQPVPVGVAGELHIGGVGLARGYFRRPELTAEKFIPHPFSLDPGARLYRTGDLARYLPDGVIEYLGRIDHQVKIRGFRIELGEIEARLEQYEAVRHAVVLARADAPGDKRLVAYVAGARHGLAVEELRRHLAAALPDYMVPSAFVLLPELPLTPNGKVDRRALPAPDRERPELERQYAGPRNAIEELVAGIWAEVLGLASVGIHDNFFALGGHSLLATQVISRVRAALRVELPLRAVFEAPTVAGLAEQIPANGRSTPVMCPPLEPVEREGHMELSFAQQRLWFLDQLMPGSAIYHIPAAVRLKGALDHSALAESFAALVRRHESLRTRFATVDGRPVQVIEAQLDVHVPAIDLSAWSEPEREVEVQRLAQEEAEQPFDLSQGPLLRAMLLQLGPAEHVLLLTLHHIVADGWSLGVLVRELAALYEQRVQGSNVQLADLPVQYADFAHWQREWLAAGALEEQLGYWKQQLAGSVPVLALPQDHPRPAVPSYRGQSQVLQLGPELTAQLKALSRQQGVTLFMTLLAAFQTLLARYSGQSDILVGTPIANRTRKETEGLIGFFVNTLVLRTDLSDNPPFPDLLARVREVCLSAYAHQDVPFEQVVEALDPHRDLSHHPLFQVMFALQNAPEAPLAMTGLSWSVMEPPEGIAKFDLTLAMTEVDGELRASMEYNTDLFEADTIGRMLLHFRNLLESVVAAPDGQVKELEIWSAAERQQVLGEWNQTTTDYPQNRCIHELFEAQAERAPDAVAVVFGDQQLTYRELNQRAGELAEQLEGLGVGPEVLVGIGLERSLEMVVGIMAILKAGGAYMPLDPTYPKERLAFMMEDSQMAVLLTQERLLAHLPEHRAQVVLLDGGVPNRCRGTARRAPTVGPQNTAYVMYTSGSTGKPKGIAIPHRAVNRLVCNTNYIQLQPADRIAQASNASFDAMTFELWGALLNGARLVGIPKDVALSPLEFAAQICEQGITTLFLTTALFNQVASEAPWAFESVRHLLFGGQAVDARWVRSVLSSSPPDRVLHVYGPTESTTFASWHLAEDVPEGAATVPIGRPIANTHIYLLDPDMRPVPIGVAGELYIGGDGLASGYLNQSELTATTFVPHPFSDEPGKRLYRTGDLGRYLPDGSIEFLGRIDHQVKIRGFRIELGEVEAALARHQGVREALVVAREYKPGDQRLIAYVVAAEAAEPTSRELRAFLSERLPDYMVPAAFMHIEHLPLTPNGKVDRDTLPAPFMVSSEVEAEFVAPRSPVEEVLAGICAEVLGLERVGIHDSFFDLGGHSLLATQLASRVRDTFQVELPLRRIFEAPTVAELGEALLGEPEQRVRVEKTADLVLTLAQLPEDEVQRILDEEMVLNN